MWVNDRNAALLTDLYELTMLQAYFLEGMEEEATFGLWVRRLPKRRNYLLACGLEHALRYLETLRFPVEALEYLRGLKSFRPDFLDWLSRFRFTGEVRAMPEGTPFFAGEPILEVTATLPQAQLCETFLMNQIHFATLAASKASRVVRAAAGRRVVDFGLRRIHGTDAGMKAARAFFIAGVDATSNVLAGMAYGLPVAGTMAHSYVQAHDDEFAAFAAFAEAYPETTLLVDTYDTLAGVERVIRLARDLGDDFRVGAVRLDSGDLAGLARRARDMLDGAGLPMVSLFASGGLDEYEVARLAAAKAPIDGFGVGTNMGVSADAPSLDMVYKLVAYAGRGRMKVSPSKRTLPGAKQVFRKTGDGLAQADVIGLRDEDLPGRPLLRPVMRGGRRLPDATQTLGAMRKRAAEELALLPERLLGLDPADPPYPVEVGPELSAQADRLARRLAPHPNR